MNKTIKMNIKAETNILELVKELLKYHQKVIRIIQIILLTLIKQFQYHLLIPKIQIFANFIVSKYFKAEIKIKMHKYCILKLK